MKKENFLWGIIAISVLLAILSPILPSFNKRSLEAKVALLPQQSFTNHKIDISEGKTEIEKSLIIKFNNWIDFAEYKYQLLKNKQKSTRQYDTDYYSIASDFIKYFKEQEFNISNTLKVRIGKELEELMPLIEKIENYDKKTSTEEDKTSKTIEE